MSERLFPVCLSSSCPCMPMPSDSAEVMVGLRTLQTLSYDTGAVQDTAPCPIVTDIPTGDQSGPRLTLLYCGEGQRLSGAHAADCSCGLLGHHPKSCHVVDASHWARVATDDLENTTRGATERRELVSAAAVHLRSSDPLDGRAPLEVPHDEPVKIVMLNCVAIDLSVTEKYPMHLCTGSEVAAIMRPISR